MKSLFLYYCSGFKSYKVNVNFMLTVDGFEF